MLTLMKDRNRGGNRYGVKAKPRTLETKVLASPDGSLSRVAPKRQACVILMTRGARPFEVAKALGIGTATICQWRKTDWFKQLYQTELDLLRADVNKAMEPLLPKALGTYDRALDADDTQVARDVLDRSYGKPLAHETPQSPVSINIVFRSADPVPEVIDITPND